MSLKKSKKKNNKGLKNIQSLIPKKINPDNGNKNYENLYTGTLFNRKMQRALHKAYVEFPEADYFDMKNSNTETHRMFLGRKTKLTATVKAYKYRYPQR